MFLREWATAIFRRAPLQWVLSSLKGFCRLLVFFQLQKCILLYIKLGFKLSFKVTSHIVLLSSCSWGHLSLNCEFFFYVNWSLSVMYRISPELNKMWSKLQVQKVFSDSGIASNLLNSEMMCSKDVRAIIRTKRMGGKQCLF